jgi:hypothetical protein
MVDELSNDIPRAFISYSWSSPAQESWVLDLATQLREDGVDVILDKWDLREGYDAIAFMEKMVTDASVRKVIIISDCIYAEKADGRKGGVGTETQIISVELYGKTDQNKFCVVLSELDAEGRPYLPTYYKSRIFIDMSSEEMYTSNYEHLLRWLFDKPAFAKPSLGTRPSFLSESNTLSLPVNSKFRRAIDALQRNLSGSLGFVEDYFDAMTSNFELLRLKDTNSDDYDDHVVRSIDDWMPYRNELIEIFNVVARHDLGEPHIMSIHRLFEKLLPYLQRPRSMSSYRQWDFDNYRFIVWEIYLYAVAIFIQRERFAAASIMVNTMFYVDHATDYGREPMQSFVIIYDEISSLEQRNRRLKLNRVSVRADLLEKRSHTSGLDFRCLIQADFVLYLRAALANSIWHPETLVYMSRLSTALEIFARAESKRYFDKIKSIFQIENKEAFEPLISGFRERKMYVPRFNYSTINPEALMNIGKLASRP